MSEKKLEELSPLLNTLDRGGLAKPIEDLISKKVEERRDKFFMNTLNESEIFQEINTYLGTESSKDKKKNYQE